MPGYIDPNQYVISRKRKKYRFAKFHNSELCFEHADWTKRAVDVIEIGAGDGLFLVAQAAANPEKTFAALDVKGDRLQKGAYAAAEQGVTNIVFIRSRADLCLELFEPGTVAEIWVTFPDPYPKKGSARRRLTHPYFLDFYIQLLAPGGSLYIKHDNLPFFTWSLEQLVGDNWHIRELSFNLHESDLAARYKICTSYEKRWLSEDLQTNFVHVTPGT